jgi:hypothetical protein
MTEISINETASRNAAGWAAAVLLALLALFAGIALFHAGAGAFFRVPQNFLEGWNAYLAHAAYDGALYLPYDAPVANNYPPLSYYLIGGLAQWGGDPIYIGRFISGAALITVALNIYAILRMFEVDRLTAAGVGIAFLGFVAIPMKQFIATNEPQWLAHAVMMSGLTGFLRSYPRRAAMVGCAFIMLAAGLIKHNLLPVPLAVTLWLLLYDRPGLRLWIAACAAGGAAVATLLWGLHGRAAFDSIFLLERQYQPLYAVNAAYQLVLPTLPVLALFVARGMPADRRARLLVFYAVFALVWGIYTMSAVGVIQNALMDFYIAIALLTGLSMRRLTEATRVYALVAIALPLAVLASNLPKPHRVWQSLQQHEAEFKRDEAAVRAAGGPAMCLTSTLCYWAEKSFEYDPFNTKVKLELDPAYREMFVRKIRDKYFAIIQLYKLTDFPPDFVDAVNKNYVSFHPTDTGWEYYRPR